MPFQKGHPRYGGMRKQQKTYKTIQKEKAREIFENAHLKRWELISEAQAKAALKHQKAREFSVNQVIGRPTETVEHKGLEFLFDEKDKVE